MLRLGIVIVSTRPGRVGPSVARWFEARARAHGKFEVRLVDLAEVALPVYDEPRHPRLGQYEHAHTRAWSEAVKALDAFAFVTPEYNYGAPPSLLNALDYLFQEWAYKPAMFVSYGGISGGLRSVQMAKLTLTALRVMPLPEAVTIPFVASQLEAGVLKSSEALERSAATALDELHRWAEALRPLRG
jgi:NAD(P)H-dependent FMN reductase